jgi:hypothetical protein
VAAEVRWRTSVESASADEAGSRGNRQTKRSQRAESELARFWLSRLGIGVSSSEAMIELYASSFLTGHAPDMTAAHGTDRRLLLRSAAINDEPTRQPAAAAVVVVVVAAAAAGVGPSGRATHSAHIHLFSLCVCLTIVCRGCVSVWPVADRFSLRFFSSPASLLSAAAAPSSHTQTHAHHAISRYTSSLAITSGSKA